MSITWQEVLFQLIAVVVVWLFVTQPDGGTVSPASWSNGSWSKNSTQQNVKLVLVFILASAKKT